MSAPRPICVHCGAKYGQRSTRTVRWRRDEDEPEPQGIVKYGSVRTADGGIGVKFQDVDVWDGKTWIGGYEPFCTLRCALDFARKAHRRGA